VYEQIYIVGDLVRSLCVNERRGKVARADD